VPELAADYRTQLMENGYVLVPGAVSPELCAAVVDLIWKRLDRDPDDPATWYGADPTLFELYHAQEEWDVRQHPALLEAFAQVLGTEQLWVSTDRVWMKPPLSPEHPEYHDSGFVHLDFDPRPGAGNELPWTVQGVVVLTDTDVDQGGFWCVPEVYRVMDEWQRDQPAELQEWSYGDFEPTSVPGRAGDLVIWSARTPHGNGPNHSTRPRLAQYVTMFPALCDDEAARAEQIRGWQDRLVPSFGRKPLTRESDGPPARLTALGRKLVGLDAW
jgi:hypothetical protein